MARVLLADDEPVMHDVIGSMLAVDGHAVDAVGTVSQAVLAYDTEKPALLILDVNMKDGGAEEILRRLDAREGGVACPVIVISGDGEWEGIHPQVQAVMGKPFDLAAFRQAVSSALARP